MFLLYKNPHFYTMRCISKYPNEPRRTLARTEQNSPYPGLGFRCSFLRGVV